MNTNPLNEGVFTINSAEVGEISDEMVAARALELALIAGRAAIQSDFDQARRELTGGPGMDPQQELLESIPEAERWNLVVGSTGQQAQVSVREDENADGQSESAQLVEHGLREAEHDQMLQAARATQEQDQRDR